MFVKPRRRRRIESCVCGKNLLTNPSVASRLGVDGRDKPGHDDKAQS